MRSHSVRTANVVDIAELRNERGLQLLVLLTQLDVLRHGAPVDFDMALRATDANAQPAALDRLILVLAQGVDRHSRTERPSAQARVGEPVLVHPRAKGQHGANEVAGLGTVVAQHSRPSPWHNSMPRHT